MKTPKAIMAFSQSEKVKSGIIWTSQALEMSGGLQGHEKTGAEKIIRLKVDAIVQEIRLAGKLTGDPVWRDIEAVMDQALVMINSGVGPDSVIHLTRALSMVTGMGHRSMSSLKEKGLL